MATAEGVRQRLFRNAGVPTDGASGTHSGDAHKGALCADVTNGTLYINTGTQASPTWSNIPSSGNTLGSISAYNDTGGTLTAGTLVYLTGFNAANDVPTVGKADANADGKIASFVVPEDILNAAVGQVSTRWETDADQNTSGYASAGDPVYLSETVGASTATAPTAAGSIKQKVGFVKVKDAAVGVIEYDLIGVDKIGTDQLQDGAVTLAKLGADSVGDSELVDNAVSNAHMNPFQGSVQHLTFEYDFAATGGALGPQALTLPAAGGALTIPDNAVVVGAWLEGITVGASGGGSAGTVKLGITGNDDCFIAATAEDHANFAADKITALTNELPLKTSAAVSVLATIAGDAWTQGKYRVHVEYYEGA